MVFRDTVQDYKRSAARRLEDALELMEMPTHDAQRSDAARRHLRGAMWERNSIDDGIQLRRDRTLINRIDRTTELWKFQERRAAEIDEKFERLRQFIEALPERT